MDAVEEIKSRLAIEDVIGQYVQLKRAGRNLKGLSPFTNERTASFVVSPEKQIWHDFSSGKGGSMFSFVMEMEGLDFKGALELLARKAGVDLGQYRKTTSGGQGKSKERLYEALQAATHFYQVQFSKHRPALEYVLQKRGFSKQTALEWRLGYSPESGTALVDFLTSKGFNEQEIKAAGLGTQRYRGWGDMFRGRVMIPLADAQGRVIGFTARLLQDDPNAPKYINTPQTVLYDKSRHVFGLHLAKEAIRKSTYVVVAEGQLDVISSHQAGVRQVVATAGTALTEQHLKALGRFVPDIRLSFDADKAGLNATERAIPIASKVGVSLSIITLPGGKDPDELIRQDPTQWQSTIESPQYALDWLIERYQKQLDITSGPGKRRFSDVIMAVVRDLTDPVEQEHYVARIGALIGVSREALLAKLQNSGSTPPVRLKKPAITQGQLDKAAIDLIKTQTNLLALVIFRTKLRDLVADLSPHVLPSPEARELLVFLQQKPDFAGDITSVPALLPLEDYVKMLSLTFEELYQDVELLELSNEATRLRNHLVSRYVNTQKSRISAELAGNPSDSRAQALMEADKKLNSLLKIYRGN